MKNSGEAIAGLTKVLNRYSANLTEYRLDRQDLEINGLYHVLFQEPDTATMTVKFHNMEDANKFVNVLVQLEDELRTDELIRKGHPQLQEAYEAYKIMLRLCK